MLSQRFRRLLSRGQRLLTLVLTALLSAVPAPAFDTFWHSAATSAATRQFGFTDGEKHKTSSASIILFDNNKDVIWKAPQ